MASTPTTVAPYGMTASARGLASHVQAHLQRPSDGPCATLLRDDTKAAGTAFLALLERDCAAADAVILAKTRAHEAQKARVAEESALVQRTAREVGFDASPVTWNDAVADDEDARLQAVPPAFGNHAVDAVSQVTDPSAHAYQVEYGSKMRAALTSALTPLHLIALPTKDGHTTLAAFLTATCGAVSLEVPHAVVKAGGLVLCAPDGDATVHLEQRTYFDQTALTLLFMADGSMGVRRGSGPVGVCAPGDAPRLLAGETGVAMNALRFQRAAPASPKKRKKDDGDGDDDMLDVCGATWVTLVTFFFKAVHDGAAFRSLSAAVPQASTQKVDTTTTNLRTCLQGQKVVAVNVKRMQCMVLDGERQDREAVLGEVKRLCRRLQRATLAANDFSKDVAPHKAAAMAEVAASAAALQAPAYTCFRRCGKGAESMGASCATCGDPCFTLKA